MDIIIKIAISVPVIIGLIILFRNFIIETKKQKKLIEIKNNRLNQYVYKRDELISQYINNREYIKDQQWKFQKNTGIHPRKYKYNINAMDYSGQCSYIVPKKGL